jgi:gamma-glutamyl hercynylcysteine S-oxide synthase
VALEHREMHAETFSFMLHQLPPGAKRGEMPHPVTFVDPPFPQTVLVPGGVAALGRDKGFGWDNEFGRHEVDVPPFAMDRYKVTNGDYLRFVEAGGEAPPFWMRADGGWRYRSMFGDLPLPLDWPVYATHEQADAYARFRGKRLPTEAEWHRAAVGSPRGGERRYPWGDAAPSPVHGNFDFYRWDPLPVAGTPGGDSGFGVSQLMGNGWEWTSTVFAPFAGFAPIPSYPGYSADFFDGQHYVLKGASPLTAARLLRSSFRNWFRPNYPYVYAGFRLVESA